MNGNLGCNAENLLSARCQEQWLAPAFDTFFWLGVLAGVPFGALVGEGVSRGALAGGSGSSILRTNEEPNALT